MRYYLSAVFFTIFLSSCSSLSLSTDYDNKIDFSTFKTYRWHNENDHNAASLKYINHLIDQRIRNTIDRQLQSQSYVLKSTGDVDFYVNYSVVIDERADIHTYNNYSGMYPGYRGYGYYGGGFAYSTGSQTQITHYKQGTLIIDIINPETDQLMWRGAADGRLPKSVDKRESDDLAQQYVTKILSNFPPKESR